MGKIIDAVIFDLDGVLVDSQPALLKAITETLSQYAIDVTETQVREQVGGGTRKTLRFFLEKVLDPDQVDKCLDEATERKNNLQTSYTDRVALLPLAKRLLIQLKDSGFSLALATMSARNVVDKILDYHVIKDYFEVVNTADDVVNGKPDPEILEKTIEQLDKEVKRTLYIGDSAHDLEPASRLGMPFLLADTGIYVLGEERKRLRSIAEEKGYPIVSLPDLLDIGEIASGYHRIARK